MLHRDPVREGGEVGGALGRGQRGGEGRAGAGGVRVGAQPVLQGHRVRGQVVHVRPGALVGVGHRAAALEAPLARGADRAVDAPRARRRGGDDARPVPVPGRGDLHHERDVATGAGWPASAGPRIGEGQVLGARDLPLAEGVVARRVDVGPEQGAVAALGIDVDQRGVVAEDREPAQLGGRGRHRVGRHRRGSAEAGPAQPGRQQVVAHAVVDGPGDLAEVRRLDVGGGLVAVFSAAGEQDQGQHDGGPAGEGAGRGHLVRRYAASPSLPRACPLAHRRSGTRR